MPLVIRIRPFGARLIALAVTSLFLASCGGKGLVVIALDEAFSAARPDLARELRDHWPIRYRARATTLRLSGEPGEVLSILQKAEKQGEHPVALIASPLLAQALPGPWRSPGTELSCLGGAALLVPEWHAVPPSGVAGSSGAAFALAVTENVPAYAVAGSASGAYIASLRGPGGEQSSSPAGAILFLEAPARPREALEAFAKAYENASGGAPLLVRELGASEDEQKQAEAAVHELLGADVRLLFVALGAGGPAAIRAATRPGLLLGGDFPGPQSPGDIAFRVRPDDGGIAEALRNALLSRPGKGKWPRRDAIPALVETMPAGKDPSRKAIVSFIRSARRETKGR